MPECRSAERSLADKRGFALLVTIVLVAFLVLILVGLATFTRVETQVADNSQNLAKARQNALFALNVAVGELQRTTGPDQRSTVVADMGTVGDGDAATIDNGLPSANDGTYAWTAALGNTANPINQTDARKAGHTAEVPAVLNWLVSGNERVTFTPSVAATNFGQITATPPASAAASGAIQFVPGAAITGLSATTKALDALKIKNTQNVDKDAVLLVGPGSAANSVTPAAPQANYVVAPLVDIVASAGAVPGLAATDTPTIGRYAWWVGDEGVKARVNLVDPNAGQTTGAQARLRTMVAPRAGTELIAGFEAATPSTTPASDPIGRVVSNEQFPFLAGVTADEAKARFHDVTPFSMGVLADSAKGGLKKDLTRGFFGAGAPPAEIGGTEEMFTVPTGSDSSGVRPDRLPSWGALRSYARLATDSSMAGSTPEIATQTTTNSRMGIHPVITRLQLYTWAFAHSSSTELIGAYFPAVVLWNPYDVTLKARDYYVYFEFDRQWPSRSTWPTSGKFGDKWPAFKAVYGPPFAPTVPPAPAESLAPATGAYNPYRDKLQAASEASRYFGANKGFRMRLRGTQDIAPGQALIFTPRANTDLADIASGGNVTMDLEPEWRTAAFYERFNIVPAGNNIHYTVVAWPNELFDYMRFWLGTSDNIFTNRESADLLQVTSGIQSAREPTGHGWRLNVNTTFLQAKVKNTANDPGSIIPGSADWPDTSGNIGLPLFVADYPALRWDESRTEVPIPTGNQAIYRTYHAVLRMQSTLEISTSTVSGEAGGGSDDSYRGNRWLAVMNPLAPRLGRSFLEGYRLDDYADQRGGLGYTANPQFPGKMVEAAQARLNSLDTRFHLPTADLTEAWFGVADRATNALYVGSNSPPRKLPLVHLPRPGGSGPESGLLSIGALQHAQVHPQSGLLDARTGEASPSGGGARKGYAANLMPTYAIGNSLADPLVPANDADGFPDALGGLPAGGVGVGRVVGDANHQRFHFDLSLLLNRALWDRYFFSGIAQAPAATVKAASPSANPRLYFLRQDAADVNAADELAGTALAEARDFDKAAARLMTLGAFNVNSTSPEAWKAVLGGLRSLAVERQDGVTAVNASANLSPYARAYPPQQGVLGGNRVNDGDKFRALTDTQIEQLALEIADEVRRRGPVLSLAAFVNRKPQAGGDPASTDAATRNLGYQRYMGLLQTAIDRADVDTAAAGLQRLNDDLVKNSAGTEITQMEIGFGSDISRSWDADGLVTVAGYRMHSLVDGIALGGYRSEPTPVLTPTRLTSGGEPTSPISLRARSFGLPGYLTQADLLQALGPVLSARSDTFRVRTYGEVKNPVTGDVEGRAWLEAVVQRVPDYVDQTDSGLATLGDATPPANTNATNQRFGRAYRVVSMRWLGTEDI